MSRAEGVRRFDAAVGLWVLAALVGAGLWVAVALLAGCDTSPLFPDLGPGKPGSDGSGNPGGDSDAGDAAVSDEPGADLSGQPGRTLAWSDEFDGPAGASPDPTRWAFDIGTGNNGWGNAELEYMTGRPENVSLDGAGHLAITARQEAYQGKSYTSGRINTFGHYSRAFGRFEARMKMPTGQGMWPAFWLLGNNQSQVGWPQCGEVDIVENKGQEPNIAHGSVHGPGYSGGNSITQKRIVPGAPLSADFHVYAVEWIANNLNFSVDGTTYFVLTPSQLPAGTQWVFDHPFAIIFDLAVGGNFVGSPDATTVFPQTLLVDYVRVYEPAQ